MNATLISNRVRFVLVGLLCLGIAACGGPKEGPEEALRAWVRQGQEAAEARDRRALVKMIAPFYADARGNSRDDIDDMFRFYFLRQQDVALVTRIEELDVYENTAARLVLAVGMAGTSDGVLGFSADAYRFEMEFELLGDEWLLTAARWGEFGGDLF